MLLQYEVGPACVYYISSLALGETVRLTYRTLFPILLASSKQVVRVAPKLTGNDPQMYLLSLTFVTAHVSLARGERD